MVDNHPKRRLKHTRKTSHKTLKRIARRIPFATIILAIFIASFYYSQDASHLCLFPTSCPTDKHFNWVAKSPYPYNYILALLLEAFVHLSDGHLYTNLVNLLALGVPLESWILADKPLARYGMFGVAYFINVFVESIRLIVPVNGMFSVGYGASLMIIALAPLDFYYLHTEWPTLEGIGRFVPVSIGVGFGLGLILEIEADLLTTGSVVGENHLYAFLLACLVVALLSARKSKMKSKVARHDT
jgi:membrane associated rhomboid family serine protease